MSLALQQVLDRLMLGPFTGTLERHTSGNIVGGRRVSTLASSITVIFWTVPDGPSKLQLKTEVGSQITDNIHFYFKDASYDIKNLDRLTYDNSVYEIRGPESRPHGGFLYAYGKFISRVDTES